MLNFGTLIVEILEINEHQDSKEALKYCFNDLAEANKSEQTQILNAPESATSD